jgi:hypothetical protein
VCDYSKGLQEVFNECCPRHSIPIGGLSPLGGQRLAFCCVQDFDACVAEKVAAGFLRVPFRMVHERLAACPCGTKVQLSKVTASSWKNYMRRNPGSPAVSPYTHEHTYTYTHITTHTRAQSTHTHTHTQHTHTRERARAHIHWTMAGPNYL